MSNIWPLIKFGLKINFRVSILSYLFRTDKRIPWLMALIVPVGLFMAGGIYYGYWTFFKLLFQVLQPIHQENAILTFVIISAQMLVLVFGFFYIISAYYFSTDLEMLIPLPIKPKHIIGGKFITILISEYLSLSPLILPGLIFFGILAHVPFSYWLMLPIIYLLIPVIPIGIVSLLVIGMMRLLKFSRKKDVMITVGSILLIILIFTLQFQLHKLDRMDRNKTPGAAEIGKMISQENGLVRSISAYFPPGKWAHDTLIHGFSTPGISSLAILTATSLLFFYLLVLIGQKIFYEGVLSISESGGKKSTLTKQELSEKVSMIHHPVIAIFWREWRIMNRTPIFLLNGPFSVFMFPIVFLLVYFKMDPKFTQFVDSALKSVNPMIPILMCTAFMLLSAAINGIASSTFSREGEQFWISKIIPVSWKHQCMGKFLHSFSIAFTGILTTSAVLILYKVHFKILLASALIAIIASVFFILYGMIVDLRSPLLNWTEPQKAMKKNGNVLFTTFTSIAIIAGVIYGVYQLAIKEVPFIVTYLLLIFIFGGGAYFLSQFLLKFAKQRYPAIEI